ncbi:arabinogalactan endo-beta-1,4-galactanase [Novosphingobium sp.]|uniref:glycoside hydrolase family 53 protein n=1 Tax=Novosphingobium sp. TaxID=1874826 RepID=UPI0038B8926A
MRKLLIAGLLASAPAHATAPLHLGADLSFTNEMEDCGAVFREHGQKVDPFALIKAHGANIVRVRLWNDPKWTRYSTYDDALKTIRRAHAAGMQVLLDFHYSDDWADGDHQNAPAAWVGLSADQQARALHDYTRDILDRLAGEHQLPEFVQVGNETNRELLAGEKDAAQTDWKRNAALLNAGLAAVREASRAHGTAIKTMLHIAQPENIIGWFDNATAAGVLDYDIIGISYYSKWSKYNLAGLGKVIDAAHRRYGAEVWVVETAYPFTTDFGDDTGNLLGTDSAIPGYPVSPEGQARYLEDLTRTVVANGGNGVVYWAPDWVSTKCKTRWGTGSSWENAAWFTVKDHEAVRALRWMSVDYTVKK